MRRSTSPLPTVWATPVPNTKAATKLKNAAHSTAWPGDSTRVDTTVATELAASWNPLMKSNIRAMAMIAIVSSRTGLMSTVLDHDALQHIGYVLAAVGGGFQKFVNFFQFHQRDGVFFIVEEFGNGPAHETVGHVLQPVDFDAMFRHLLLVVESLKAFLQAGGAVVNEGAELHHGRRDWIQTVGEDAMGGVFDAVQHVVQARGKRVDVLRIERSDECLVQAGEGVVNDLVALRFQGSDFLAGPRHGRVAVPHCVQQQPGGFDDQLHLTYEQREELFFARQESEEASLFVDHPYCRGLGRTGVRLHSTGPPSLIILACGIRIGWGLGSGSPGGAVAVRAL